jgi:hypothetical protein
MATSGAQAVTKGAATKGAATKGAATKAATPLTTKKRGGSLLILLLLTPVALLLLPTTLVLLPAMIPTAVARIVDPGPGRHLTITVGSLNLAGALWFVHDIWSAGQSFAAISPALSDMMAWLAALVGAGCGWAIHWVMPVISRRIAEAKSSVRLARLRKRQTELVEQWGEPVRSLTK